MLRGRLFPNACSMQEFRSVPGQQDLKSVSRSLNRIAVPKPRASSRGLFIPLGYLLHARLFPFHEIPARGSPVCM